MSGDSFGPLSQALSQSLSKKGASLREKSTKLTTKLATKVNKLWKPAFENLFEWPRARAKCTQQTTNDDNAPGNFTLTEY